MPITYYGEHGEIFLTKRAAVIDVVPHQRRESVRSQNPAPLAARALVVEPMKRLGTKNSVDAARRQRRGIGGAVDADEVGERAKRGFRGAPHVVARLDGVHDESALEQELREDTRA